MLLPPKEFAEAVGVSYATFRQHLSRKKVYRSGDFIDTEYQLNKIYIEEKTNGVGLDLTKVGKSKPKKTTTKKDNVKPIIKDVEVEPLESPKKEVSREQIIYDSISLRQKRAAMEKAEKENQLKEMEIAKKMGELMPIEMVDKIFTINVQTIFRSFEHAAENVASTYCEILGGDRTHLSEMIEEMRHHLQKSIKEVKVSAADEIKKVIKEYAAVRGRGERR